MKTFTKEKLELRHPLNKGDKMDLAKMKTGVGTQHPWINPALFRALPVTTRPASGLLWSAATFLLALPSNLLVRVCVCIFHAHYQHRSVLELQRVALSAASRAATLSVVLTLLLHKPLFLSMIVASASDDENEKNSCDCSAVLSAIFK